MTPCLLCAKETYEGAYGFDGELVPRSKWEQTKAYIVTLEDGFYDDMHGFDGGLGILPENLPAPRDVWITKDRSFMMWSDEPEWLDCCPDCGEVVWISGEMVSIPSSSEATEGQR